MTLRNAVYVEYAVYVDGLNIAMLVVVLTDTEAPPGGGKDYS